MPMDIRLDEDDRERQRASTALRPPPVYVKPTIEDTLERIATSLEAINELAAEAVYGRNQDIRVERAREIAEQISVIHTHDGSWIHGSQENLELAAELIEALLSQDEIQRAEDDTQRR